jgi:tetratricopeptide (TPR) repeat protein
MAEGIRSALIIATDTFEDPGLSQLRAPAQDADALANVLGDERIGGFDVQTLMNAPAHEITLAIEDFFADRRSDDLLLLHVSCHGVKGESGELYFATTNTRLRRLAATSVAADFVNQRMVRSRSKRIVLLLDCCYAGAFARGMTPRAGPGVGISEHFAGNGHAVITASDAMQYAFEDASLADDAALGPSRFTTALVEGLATGEADRDQDGLVELDELYDYIHDRMLETSPDQTPTKWTFGLQGALYIARRAEVVETPLATELQQLIESPFAEARESAVPVLARLHGGRHAGLALAARRALERLADDDSRTVAARAADELRDDVDPEVVRWYEEALALLRPAGGPPSRAQLEQAVSALDRVVAREPNHRDAPALLTASRRKLAATLYGEATHLLISSDWHAALAVLERVGALDPEHGDPDGLHQQAAAVMRLEQAERFARQGSWKDVLDILDGSPAEIPQGPRAADLAAEAERRIRARTLVELGRDAYGEGRWKDTVAAFEEAAALDPDLIGDDDPMWEGADANLRTRSSQRRRVALGVAGVFVVAGVALALRDPTGPPPGSDRETDLETDLEIEHLAMAPTIDGAPDDWSSEGQIRTEKPGNEEHFPDPAVESTWRLGWDEDALYFFVQVADQQIQTSYEREPWELQRGDSVEFHFGPDPTGLADDDGLRASDVQFMMGPATGDASGPAVSGIRRRQPRDDNRCGWYFVGDDSADTSSVEAFAALTDEGYDIEARVPWGVLAADPAPGSVYGMNLTVNDAGQGDGAQRRSTNENREKAKHCPGLWNTAQLLPPPDG